MRRFWFLMDKMTGSLKSALKLLSIQVLRLSLLVVCIISFPHQKIKHYVVAKLTSLREQSKFLACQEW